MPRWDAFPLCPMPTGRCCADERTDLTAPASFTDEVSERLEYVGSALLVMDRVTLDPPWRGHGLAAVLASEAKQDELRRMRHSAV